MLINKQIGIKTWLLFVFATYCVRIQVMTYAEALAKKERIEEELAKARQTKFRLYDFGQEFSQTDGDARNEIKRVSYDKLCNEIRRLEAELADINALIDAFLGRGPKRRKSLKMRCV